MKIHVVQKGDTLWELAKKYGVDFEELKQMNTHLASPDMIMPGMKIRIPTTAKTVKKEGVMKEVQKEAEHPFMNISPKPLPVIKEDEKETQVVQPTMPMPQMPQVPPTISPIMQAPTMEQELNTYMTFNFPEEESHEESSSSSLHEEIPVQQPVMQQPIMQPMPCPVHFVPCYPVNPCCGHYHHPYPMQFMQPMVSPQQMMPINEQDCGCGGGIEVPQTTAMSPYEVDPNQFGYMPTGTGPAQTMPYTNLPDWNMPSYPTPPGYGELRASDKEDSFD